MSLQQIKHRINGKNWPVYNQLLGQQSHGSKMANITLVGLHLEH